MNKAVTSREDILAVSKEMVAENGMQAINMRNVAGRCGVAVGSVYNYFPSKNDLMIAVIDAIWKEITQGISDCRPSSGFLENIEKLFYSIKSGGEKYPASVKSGLLDSLQKDQRVKQEFFSEKCTQTDFIEFVFSNLLSLLIHERDSCDLLLKVIEGAIYK